MPSVAELLQSFQAAPWEAIAGAAVLALYVGIRLAVAILCWSDRRRTRIDQARMRAAATRGERGR